MEHANNSIDLTLQVKHAIKHRCWANLALDGIDFALASQLIPKSAILDSRALFIKTLYLDRVSSEDGEFQFVHRINLTFCFGSHGTMLKCYNVHGGPDHMNPVSWYDFKEKSVLRITRVETRLVTAKRSSSRHQLKKYLKDNNVQDHYQAVASLAEVLLGVASGIPLSKLRLFIVHNNSKRQS